MIGNGGKMLDKKMVIISVLVIVLLLGSVIYVSTMASPTQNTKRRREFRHHARTFSAEVVEITKDKITLQHDENKCTFSIVGRWVVREEGKAKIINGSSLLNYFSIGDKVNATVIVFNRTGTRHVYLLKLVKEGVFAIHTPGKAALKRNIKKTRVIDIEAQVKTVKDKFFVIEKGQRTIVVVGRGSWTIAGDKTVSWSELLSKLNQGDKVWLYGRVILLKKGVRGAKIFFYPKTIIDITNGFSAIRK